MISLQYLNNSGGVTGYIMFFFNDPATTEIYTLSLHDALPISLVARRRRRGRAGPGGERGSGATSLVAGGVPDRCGLLLDRKSTRLNSSHANISYAVFCLKKKTNYISY